MSNIDRIQLDLRHGDWYDDLAPMICNAGLQTRYNIPHHIETITLCIEDDYRKGAARVVVDECISNDEGVCMRMIWFDRGETNLAIWEDFYVLVCGQAHPSGDTPSSYEAWIWFEYEAPA